MRKIVYQFQDENILDSIEDSGYLSDQTTMVYDEAVDGPLDPLMVEKFQGLERVNGQPSFNKAKYDAWKSAKDAEDSAVAAQRAKVEEAKDFLKSVNPDEVNDPVVAAMAMMMKDFFKL